MKYIAYYQEDGTGRWVSSIADDAPIRKEEGLLHVEVTSPPPGVFHVVGKEIREGPKPISDPKVLQAQLLEEVRARRARLLGESDWVVMKALEKGEPVPLKWKRYRQALRDLPEDPSNIIWPEVPK